MKSENIGVCLIESGDIFLHEKQLILALGCYERALQLNLSNNLLTRLYNNLGVTYKRLGRLEDAKKLFENGIKIDAMHLSFYTNLASVFEIQGNLKHAQHLLEKALQLELRVRDAFKLVEIYQRTQQIQSALKLAVTLTHHFPEVYDTHLTLGNIYASLKQFDKAMPHYEKAVTLDPNKTQALNNIGIAYKELGYDEKALKAYQAVIALNPNDSAVYNNLGNLLRQMGNYEGALGALKHSIKLNPSYADAYSNIGAIFKEQKLYDQAEPHYRKALMLSPHHINANFDLALIELSRGNYNVGWQQYEYRLLMKELLVKTHHYMVPIWKGETLQGKTIILQNEQGFGDNIMFVRYAKKFLALGANVILRTRPELVKLFQTIDNDIHVIDEESSPLPLCDFYLPLLSSARRFGTTLETIPKDFPYLHVNKDTIDVSLLADTLKVGLVWSSSPTNKDFKNKYIGLALYKKLFMLEHVHWVSLQIGEDAKDIEREGLSETILDIAPSLKDFYETARMVRHLDLVITTDTAVAHLCGALNTPAWVLVPKPADWRWMQEGDHTPWYKSIRLFRQKEQGNWVAPMEAIYDALQVVLKGSKSV